MADESAPAPWLAGQLFTDAAWLSSFDGEESDSTASSADGASEPVVLVFKNETAEPLTLCWVDARGKLHHFYSVNPATGPKAIQDGSVEPSHTEFASLGDHFVVFDSSAACQGQVEETSNIHWACDIPPEAFVLAYTPTAKAGTPHVVTMLPSSSDDIDAVRAVVGPGSSGGGKLLDTSNKVMEKGSLSGFVVHAEPGAWQAFPGLRRTLKEDLSEVCRRLPPGAVAALQAQTAFWVNVSLTYGREGALTVGRSMCYHPRGGGSWLTAQGMNPAKAGGIEMCVGVRAQMAACSSISLFFLQEMEHQAMMDAFPFFSLREQF